MATVRCQSVAVRADAAEGTRNVVTTESALMAHLLTFIHVLADLHRSRSESIGAIAFESSFDVGTRSVAANIGNGAFVIICQNQKKFKRNNFSKIEGKNRTDAFTTGTVQDESHWTFAAEGSVRVDALATFTNARHDVTFIEIFALRSASRSTRTKFLKFGFKYFYIKK